MKYTKLVKVTSTGMIQAEVCNSSGLTKGIKFFTPFIYTNKAVERNCKKAHAWADERIKICERQET